MSSDSVDAPRYVEPADFFADADDAPPAGYSLDVIKNGVIVDKVELSKKRVFTLGRHPKCDLTLIHPSLSRHHAVLQYKSTQSAEMPKGFYLLDLESTHGTFHNKKRCFANRPYRLFVGHSFKVGLSSRLFVFNGPEEDQEEESPLSATELMQIAKEKREQAIKKVEEKKESENADEGVSWGMAEDAVEMDEAEEENATPDMSLNPFSNSNSNLDLEDPKRTLRLWFEREGYDLEYKCEEKGYANFRCTVALPLETGTVVAEASVKKGKKKEAVVQCALEACRILDKYGVLRSAKRESRKERSDLKRLEEDEFYASDEDNFLDRTGTVEEKRRRRMKRHGFKEGKGECDQESRPQVLTYDKAVEKRQAIENQIEAMKVEIEGLESRNVGNSKKDDEDDLDNYMSSLQRSSEKEKIKSKKLEVTKLQMEVKSLEKLIIKLQPAIPVASLSNETKESDNKFKMPSLPLSNPLTIVHKSDDQENEVKKSDDVPPSKATEEEAQYNIETETDTKMTKEKVQESSTTASLSERIVGPRRPDTSLHSVLALVNQEGTNATEADDMDNPVKKRPRKEKSRGPRKEDRDAKSTNEYDSSDPRFATWLPPQDQSGDGKTALNEKLGY